MSILTGKAKDDFEKWLNEGNHTPWIAFFYNLPETVMNAYYVEWFDSMGIYILITEYDGEHLWADINGRFRLGYAIQKPTRQEATKAAILTCNDLYNERN